MFQNIKIIYGYYKNCVIFRKENRTNIKTQNYVQIFPLGEVTGNAVGAGVL